MPTVITPITLRNLATRLFNSFEEAGQRGANTALLDSLVMRVPSTTRYNTYNWLEGVPGFREWVGQRMVHGLAGRAYQIINKDYENTVGVDRNSLDESGIADAATVVRMLRENADQLPFDLVIDQLRNGHQRVAYDGQNFFDTDHPVNADGTGGTQSNLRTGLPLTRDNYIVARTALRGFKGALGRPFPTNNGVLTLIVPPELEDAAAAIVVSDGGSPGGNPLRGTANIVVAPELSVDPTTWYLVSPGGTLKALVLQEKQAPRFVSKTAPDEENMFWHKEYIFGADASYGVGYGAWWKIIKAVG